MSKKTLLEIVQSTLGSLDSDAVNSIGETIESEQIAITAQEVYLELATYQNVPQFEQLTQLLGMNDNTMATVMKIPDGCTDIKDVRYKRTQKDGTSRFETVDFMDKEDFLDLQLNLRVGEADVGENVLGGNVRVPYYNDRTPQCWTTFDDEHLVFDAIDTEVQGDETLHNDNSLILAYIVPEFRLEDDFTPDLPLKLFPQYLNMIKEINSNEQRQITSELRTRKAEREGHRNRHFAGINDGSDKGYSGRTGFGRQVGHGRGHGRGRFGTGSGLPRIK